MSDLIDRQAAIELIERMKPYHQNADDIAEMIANMPSAQTERLTDDDFETIRIHLNAYKEKLCNQQRWKEAEEYQRIIDRFMTFASAQANLQPTCNELATDTISRQAAVDALARTAREKFNLSDEFNHYLAGLMDGEMAIRQLPSAQPERDIPKKPIATTDRSWGIPNRQAVCPNCDSCLGTVHFLCEGDKRKVTYCESCGQAIDWEGWEEDE